MNVPLTGRLLVFSLFKRQRLIWQLSLTIVVTVMIGSSLLPPTYEAVSTVLVRGRSYQELLSPAGRGDTGRTVLLNPKDEINSEIEIIKSRPVLESAVKSLKLYEPRVYWEKGFFGTIRNIVRLPWLGVRWLSSVLSWGATPDQAEAIELAVNALQQRLRVEPAAESMIIRIKYRDRDPQLASQVVNAVTDFYLRQHLVINLSRGQSSFFAEQIDQVKKELKELQDQLVALKEKTGLLSFAEQSRLLLKQLDTFETTRANLQKEIFNIKAKLEKIQELRQAKPGLLIPLPEIAQDVQIQDLENKLINMRFQMNSVTQRYTGASRQVETATEQLRDLDRQIRQQVSQILDREGARLKALEAEKEAVEQTIMGIKAEIEQLPAREVALQNLSKEIETKQEALTVLWKKYQDSLITENTDERLENVKVVSLAAVPLKPVRPILWLNALLGLILGLVVSFSVAFFLTYWDDTINLPEDVERYLALPVCGSIPEIL
jgi:uncharacterized protein involved in exopolysaccharide biosynthesis